MTEEFDFSAELAAARNIKPRTMAWVLTIFGAVGFFASFALAVEKFLKLANPDHIASCTLNIFLDCADAMGSAQGAIFGFPNPLLGVAAFPVVITLGVLGLTGVTWPHWIWLALLAGTTLGLILIGFLIYTSIHVLIKLCPYCLVVWAAMIPLFWYQLVHAVQEGLVPAGTKTTEFVVKNRTLLLAGLYGVVLVWIALGMGPEILAYLRS